MTIFNFVKIIGLFIIFSHSAAYAECLQPKSSPFFDLENVIIIFDNLPSQERNANKNNPPEINSLSLKKAISNVVNKNFFSCLKSHESKILISEVGSNLTMSENIAMEIMKPNNLIIKVALSFPRIYQKNNQSRDKYAVLKLFFLKTELQNIKLLEFIRSTSSEMLIPLDDNPNYELEKHLKAYLESSLRPFVYDKR